VLALGSVSVVVILLSFGSLVPWDVRELEEKQRSGFEKPPGSQTEPPDPSLLWKAATRSKCSSLPSHRARQMTYLCSTDAGVAGDIIFQSDCNSC